MSSIATIILNSFESIQYRIAIPIAVLLCFYVPAIHAATFDCSKSLTQPERLICTDEMLSKADDHLATVYKQALRHSSTPEVLRNQQRNWLTKVRNRCDDKACLKIAYNTRIQTLSRIAPWMTNEKAKKICTSALAMINDGSIKNRFINFKPASDNERTAWEDRYSQFPTNSLSDVLRLKHNRYEYHLGYVVGGGTCGNCDIVDLTTDKLFEIYPHDEDDEDLRWAGWGTCDHLLFLMDEPIIVSGRFHFGYSLAALVSWLAPDGAKQVLCSLQQTMKATVNVVHAEDERLCEAVMSEKVKFFPWKDKVSVPESQLRALNIRADGSKGAYVDLNLDGKRELVALLDYASGAGCGSYHEWLLALTAKGTLPQSSTLNKALLKREWGPVTGRHIDDQRRFSVRLFQYEDKPYIYGQGDKTSASVVSLWENKEKTWCEYNILPQHRIKRYYPIESWPKPETQTGKK